MGNGISSLLDISRRSLSTQSQAIRVIGNNIANANNPAYSRREVELTSSGSTGSATSLALGTGVDVKGISRRVDQFVNQEYVTRVEDLTRAETRQEMLSRAEAPFSLDNTVGKIGTNLSEFFSSVEDLGADPSSIPLRSNVIQTGNTLVQSIQSAYNSIADLQREADGRIRSRLDDVNQKTSQIADLNGQIASSESASQENIALRDQRDQLLRDLGGIVKVKNLETSDGSVIVTLDNGFGLVTGTTARQLTYTTSPSFGSYPPGLDGQALGSIVYDFDPTAGNQHVDLTSTLAAGGGEIGGLLSLRGVQSASDTNAFSATGDLPQIATRIELLARDLLTRFNQTYRGADENGGTPALDASSGDLTGTAPAVFGLFTVSGAADTNADGIPTVTDLSATGFTSFAEHIAFAFSDPRRLAAALDLNAAPGATTFAPGDGRNIDNIAALRSTAVNYGTYALGGFNSTLTIEQLYNDTVSYTGGLASRANTDLTVAQDRHAQIDELRTGISGVNLDDELANLISYQRTFQASARLVSMGDQLLEQVIGLLG